MINSKLLIELLNHDFIRHSVMKLDEFYWMLNAGCSMFNIEIYWMIYYYIEQNIAKLSAEEEQLLKLITLIAMKHK